VATRTPRPAPAAPRGRNRDLLSDGLFLVAIVVGSAALYVTELGFYSDDWAFLGSLTTDGDHSSVGPPGGQDFTPLIRPRPTQVAYQTVLFGLFGLEPVGYQVVNAALLAAMAVLFYAALRELRLPRLVAVAVPAVYALLPHYSTDRFWFASFGYTLSMALYFLSTVADLRVLKAGGRSRWAWKGVAIVGLAVAGLGFEVVLPLFFLGTLVLWIHARAIAARIGHPMVFFGSNLVVLAMVVAYKVATAPGADVPGSYVLHVARLLSGSVAINFGSLGIGLPGVARWSLQNADADIVIVGLLLSLSISTYIFHVGRSCEAACSDRALWLRLVGAGLIVFALGYSIFLTTERVLFTSTGINNRVAIAAAAGVAMCFVGAIGWISAFPRTARWRAAGFSLLTALLCLAGFLITNVLATQWTEAWRRERGVLSDISREFPDLGPETSLLLDGVCPYVGPAVVFESNWDLAGALETVYEEPSVRADVVGPRLHVGDEAITTTIYASISARYLYGDKLIVFDARRDLVVPLPNSRAARAYFDTRASGSPDNCPHGSAGRGVPVLAFDRSYQRFEDRHLWP
jgi:hypothetical protein